MSDLDTWRTPQAPHAVGPADGSLADILERVLDKGIVIAGDIKIDLLDIELLTIRVRLFIASVDTARKAGIDWWETDPALSSRAARDDLREENRRLRDRLDELDPAGDHADRKDRELRQDHEPRQDHGSRQDRDSRQDRTKGTPR
ncbi:gas vesicle protein [Streptomyces sp. NPDC005865]|uniref:gas vesicle protein n=1 Tax=Streptomyces sp. NPDC005865 TaxID=3155453 RepID=UPI0033F4DD87